MLARPVQTTQVFLYDGRGAAGVRQITSLGARVTEVPLHPSISGDGSRISFATRRNVNGGNSDGSVELYLYDLPTATFSRITNAPASAATDVVSSLNDDGSVVAFNFPRVLSGAVINSELANDSEIYISTTEPRPSFGALTILNGASLGNEPATTKAVAPDSIAFAAMACSRIRRSKLSGSRTVHFHQRRRHHRHGEWPAGANLLVHRAVNFLPRRLNSGPLTSSLRTLRVSPRAAA